MTAPVHRRLHRRLPHLLLVAAAGLLSLAIVVAQEFRINEVQHGPDGTVLRHPARPDRYYRLLRGERVVEISFTVELRLGEARDPPTGLGTLRDPAPPAEAAFYRVEEVPLTAPNDSDGDGIDDLFELRHPRALNPLNPADGGAGFEIKPREIGEFGGGLGKPRRRSQQEQDEGKPADCHALGLSAGSRSRFPPTRSWEAPTFSPRSATGGGYPGPC
ncbi:MAG: hypothetical protein HYY24_14920 [Verrucomicrobia bacterium]|nr:hypothetical protein [Verrucomicrobiota bacterium]